MISRRLVLKSAAWSIPVIAVAVATPLASASVPPERVPLTCTPLNEKGQPHYFLTFSDGSSETLNQGEVNSNKEYQAMCRDKGPLS